MSHPHETVAAVMMVRNEQHVIGSCIGHLLGTVGVNRVYVVDNGSTDRTLDILRRIAVATGRVVVDTDPGEFHHGLVLTDLARRAEREGATWVLPVDADEFLWLQPGVSLQDLCRRKEIGGYRVRVCNFLQARPVWRDWPGSLVSMCVAAVPWGETADAETIVAGGDIPYIRIRYPTKLLVRATPELRLGFGHHDADGEAGPLVSLETGVVLHAPIRSFDDLQNRVEMGRRVATSTPDPGQNWHLKRLVPMSANDLAQEWRSNSFDPLRPVKVGVTQWDLRLSRIGLRQSMFMRRFKRRARVAL